MERDIIPMTKTTEDDDSVCYAWEKGGEHYAARIDKHTHLATPLGDTSAEEAEFIRDWIYQVRQLNEMVDYPEVAPIYR